MMSDKTVSRVQQARLPNGRQALLSKEHRDDCQPRRDSARPPNSFNVQALSDLWRPAR